MTKNENVDMGWFECIFPSGDQNSPSPTKDDKTENPGQDTGIAVPTTVSIHHLISGVSFGATRACGVSTPIYSLDLEGELPRDSVDSFPEPSVPALVWAGVRGYVRLSRFMKFPSVNRNFDQRNLIRPPLLSGSCASV